MTPPLLYLIGPPAAGKSTLMAALRTAYDVIPRDGTLPHSLLIHPPTGTVMGCELGRVRETFSGTDALRMDIHPQACEWIKTTTWPLVLAEGARLATRAFLTAASAQYRVHLAHLDAPPDVLDARCEKRGSTQSPSWRRGAASRARNLADWATDQPWIELHRLDSTQPTSTLAAYLRRAMSTRGDH